MEKKEKDNFGSRRSSSEKKMNLSKFHEKIRLPISSGEEDIPAISRSEGDLSNLQSSESFKNQEKQRQREVKQQEKIAKRKEKEREDLQKKIAELSKPKSKTESKKFFQIFRRKKPPALVPKLVTDCIKEIEERGNKYNCFFL